MPTADHQLATGLALGSNLGDRLAHLRQGRDLLLSLHEGPAPAAVSPVYETEPVDCPPGSASFLNAVVEIRTSLDPGQLLRQLIRLESELGRSPARERNTARSLDLDIIYAGQLVIDTPTLILPHPRMTVRRFVLQPLADATAAVVAVSPADRLVMVDPNCRPSVMTSSDVFDRTLRAVLERADVVKVSGDDLAFIYPSMEVHDAAVRLQRESGAVVLFTDGAKSVHVLTESDDVILEVPRVVVVDTVGAGDSFSGGFLAQWQSRGLGRADVANLDAVLSAARFGIAVAAITCQRPGADPPNVQEMKVH